MHHTQLGASRRRCQAQRPARRARTRAGRAQGGGGGGATSRAISAAARERSGRANDTGGCGDYSRNKDAHLYTKVYGAGTEAGADRTIGFKEADVDRTRAGHE
eukprot:gene15905-biopygen11258